MELKSGPALVIVLLLLAFPIFAHLDAAPIILWDEARLATSALEMNQTHNWLIPTVDGLPDMWSTKPPFMIWCQALMLRLLGTGETAIRLPSAMAALGACLMLFFLFARKFRMPLAGAISALVLVTSAGFVVIHGTRTGDYDALLTCLMAGYALSFFLYLEDRKTRYLYATFILLILAALTKGIEAVIFLPALFLYALYQRKLRLLLRQPHFYAGCILFLVFVPGYYLLREHYNPGYIAAVRVNELGGRFTTVIESHAGDVWYDVRLLVNEQYSYWFLMVIPGVVCGLMSKQKGIKNMTVYATLLVLVFLVTVSVSKTKLDWYTMPLFPFLAIIAGYFIYSVCRLPERISLPGQPYTRALLQATFLIIVFMNPYQSTLRYVLANVADPSIPDVKKQFKIMVKEVLHRDRNLDGVALLNEDYTTDVEWYHKALAIEHIPATMVRWRDLQPTAKVAVYLPDDQKIIERRYHFRLVDSFKTVKFYELSGLNNNN